MRPCITLPVAPAPQPILSWFLKAGLQLSCSSQRENSHWEAKNISCVYTKVSSGSGKRCDAAGVTDIRGMFCTCEVYSLASPKFLFSIFTLCLGSALLCLYVILLQSVDAICNSGRANTEPAPETGTRMLMKMFSDMTISPQHSITW